jgi:hypothetical protein
MQGEQIGEGAGKRSGRRVVATDPHFVVEVSFEDRTKLLGHDGTNIGTYTSTSKPDGSLYGEGQGVFATTSGDIATWKGIGVGRLLADGAVSYQGCLSLSTSSAKLAKLNTIAAFFQFDVDANGNTRSKFFASEAGMAAGRP